MPGRPPIVKKMTFKKGIDFWRKESIIISVKREEDAPRGELVIQSSIKKISNPLDKPHGMWYNEYSQEGEPRVEKHRQGSKKNKKNLQNPLDKPPNLWYNKYVSKRGNPL